MTTDAERSGVERCPECNAVLASPPLLQVIELGETKVAFCSFFCLGIWADTEGVSKP